MRRVQIHLLAEGGSPVNFILIISDTFRRDHLGCYGNPWIRTPYLDRFAQEATVFDRAFVGSFPTVPLRNDILTGRYTFTYKPWSPAGPDPMLQEILGGHGVLTAAFADTPHPFAPPYGYQRGFAAWEQIRGQENDRFHTDPVEIALPSRPDKLRGQGAALKQYFRNVSDRRAEEDYFPARTMRSAARWLEHNGRREEPFFLYVDTFDPHEPWDPPAHYLRYYEDGYEGDTVMYPRYDRSDYLSEQELEHIRHLYAGEVSLVDRWVGYLLETVESLGIGQDTTILFTSDHGFYHGEHGYIGKSLIREGYQQAIPLYPEVCRIPMLLRVPGTPGGRSAALVQAIDIFPTALDLFGVTDPAVSRGRGVSLLASRTVTDGTGGRALTISAPTLSYPELSLPHPATRATVTDGEWLLIYGPQHVPEGEGEPETTAMVDSLVREVKLIEGRVGPELYHLATDPACLTNRFSDPSVAEEAKRLHAGLVAFLEAHDVPERHLRFFRSLPRPDEV